MSVLVLPPLDTPLGHDCVKREIPGPGFQRVQPLTLMRQTDQEWPMPAMTIPKSSQAAIVVAAAHAKAMTAGIEADEWHQDQVQCWQRLQVATPSNGFGNAKPVRPERLARTVAYEPKSAGAVGPEYR